MNGYVTLYLYFLIGMSNCDSLWKTIFHIDDTSLMKDIPEKGKRLHENRHRSNTPNYNLMWYTPVGNTKNIRQKFVKQYSNYKPLHIKKNRNNDMKKYKDGSIYKIADNINYRKPLKGNNKIYNSKIPVSENHSNKIRSIFDDEINLKQRAIPRTFSDYKDTLSKENKKSDMIPEDIILLGGKLDGSGKWWFHEQPKDENDLPDWVKTDMEEHTASTYLLIPRQHESYESSKSSLKFMKPNQKQPVKPYEYFFLPDYSYTENDNPYYIGFNSKSGEYVIVAHSIDYPQQLIKYYNISVSVNSNFKTALHSTRFQPFKAADIPWRKNENYRKYPNKAVDRSHRIGMDIALDDDAKTLQKHNLKEVAGTKDGFHQINKISTNTVTRIKGPTLSNDNNQQTIDRTNPQTSINSLKKLVSKNSSQNSVKSKIKSTKIKTKLHRHKREINGDNTLQIVLDMPYKAGMNSRSVTKEAPPYQQDSRYGIFQGNENYGYNIQRPDSNRFLEQQQILQTYPSERNGYSQENVQMWPRASSRQISNRSNNQQYLSNQDTSHLHMPAKHFAPYTEQATGSVQYKQRPVSNVQDNSPSSSINWGPLSPEYGTSGYSSDSTAARELEQDPQYTNRGEMYEDNLEHNVHLGNVPDIEKYARVGNDGYGKAGYGHIDHSGYGHKHHSSFGYGHNDHKGYGHDDHKGYGHDDHKGYGHDDHGYGHDDHKGYGHDDHKGYGHDDHKGYGHDDHKGYGKDDYGHDHHGGYHKPSKTKKWDKGYHSKGYGKWGQTGNSGSEHHHNKKGHWKEDHEDHHKSKGTKIKTYSYGGKGWYKEETNGQEKGFGGKKGYHKHSDWGYDKTKSQDKKKPYHEYNTKLNGYHRDYGYHK